MSLREATLIGSKLRFRPILMTAFAFILGVVPLMIAHEAGAASQRSLGTAVGIGMLVATFFGVFLIPVLYVSVQGLTEFVMRKGKKPAVASGSAKPGPEPVHPPEQVTEPEVEVFDQSPVSPKVAETKGSKEVEVAKEPELDSEEKSKTDAQKKPKSDSGKKSKSDSSDGDGPGKTTDS